MREFQEALRAAALAPPPPVEPEPIAPPRPSAPTRDLAAADDDHDENFDDDDFARAAAAFDGDDTSWDGAIEVPPSRGATPARSPAPRPTSTPQREGKPRLSLDEAIDRIDPEARRVLTEVLKGQFREVRAYKK